jgi:hypothetical protein
MEFHSKLRSGHVKCRERARPCSYIHVIQSALKDQTGVFLVIVGCMCVCTEGLAIIQITALRQGHVTCMPVLAGYKCEKYWFTCLPAWNVHHKESESAYTMRSIRLAHYVARGLSFWAENYGANKGPPWKRLIKLISVCKICRS